MSEAPVVRICVEAAEEKHLAEIAALAAVVWRSHYPGIISPAQIEYMLARMYDVESMARELSNGVVYERVVINGKLAGFSSYGPMPNATELKLHKLYIHPDMQHRGLGGMLLRRVEGAAREQGIQYLVLAVNKQNTQAISAYRKHGFAIRESVVADIGGGFAMDDYVMAKRVSPATR